MSNILRSMERKVVKENIRKDNRSVKRCFEDEWLQHRDKKYITKDEDGKVLSDKTPQNTMKKKQRHFDNVDQYTRFFAYIDSLKTDTEDVVASGGAE